MQPQYSMSLVVSAASVEADLVNGAVVIYVATTVGNIEKVLGHTTFVNIRNEFH